MQGGRDKLELAFKQPGQVPLTMWPWQHRAWHKLWGWTRAAEQGLWHLNHTEPHPADTALPAAA